MGLAKDWRRQAARAMGVSLIAPVALLVAAVGLMAGGGGLGGLGSLGQISSGPTLPDTGLPPASGGSLDEARLQTAGLAPATVPALARPDAGPAEGSLPSGGERRGGPAADPRGAVTPTPAPGASLPRITGKPPAAPVSPAPAPQPPAALPADPVEEVAEDPTRALEESVPPPLGPTTGDLVDFLLGDGR